jgi:hypothetical protein
MTSETNRIPMHWVAIALLALASLANPRVTRSSSRVVHVFVALADNQHQGIIPVPAALGNGSDPQHNLYWGAAFGVKTFFKSGDEWQLLSSGPGPKAAILDRCVFKNRREGVFLVADAYEGSEIKSAVTDFLSAAAGVYSERISAKVNSAEVSFAAAGAADLLAYIGHDAFMDFQIQPIAGAKGSKQAPADHHPGLRQQSLLQPIPPANRRRTFALDDRPDGSGSLHFEGRPQQLDRQ